MALEPTLDTPPTPPPRPCAASAGAACTCPATPAYDAARLPWNVAVDQRPAAVAVPHDASEVAEVVRAAAAAGLRVAPQSSGHNAAPLAEHGLDDVVLVRLSEMTGVSIDPEARTARVVGGTLWRDVVAAAAPYGLAAMHGSSPDVAVAGYVLGGGLSWYGRQHGLAANSLLAVEVVTADGTTVLADAEHHAGAVLGAARRRRQPRHRHRAGAAAAAGHRRVRRDAALGPRARPRGGARVVGSGPATCRTR